MKAKRWFSCAALSVVFGLSSAGAGNEADTPRKAKGVESTQVRPSDLVPPRVVAPCKPDHCPFAGQHVTVLVTDHVPILTPIIELKDEYEAATGATLEIVRMTREEVYANMISDMTNRGGRFDAAIIASWWLGELVTSEFVMSYDRFYDDPRFPKWNIADVLPAPRRLLSYAGKKYMIANDHDGQVMYYRRDLLTDAKHRMAFQQRYGHPLEVPTTWTQFREVAEFFNGKDLNGDGVPDHGLVMPLKAGDQGMFHFMSLSASFVIGPTNPRLYWFDPQTMKPLVDSPGHARALATLVDLVQFGPKDMLDWDLGKGWDHFLAGRAALAVTWGDLGALAQQQGSEVRGKVGTAPLPGTLAYYSIAQRQWVATPRPNRVGNTTGGSWAGVISQFSKAPAATYYLLALMATQPKSTVYALRGWDGIDPGRRFHFLPPQGTANIDDYLRAGWDAADIRDYLRACYDNFSNEQQLPYLRIPGANSYWQALDKHLAEASSGQSTPEAALKATAVDFEEITIRLGRDRQGRAYRASLGF